MFQSATNDVPHVYVLVMSPITHTQEKVMEKLEVAVCRGFSPLVVEHPPAHILVKVQHTTFL